MSLFIPENALEEALVKAVKYPLQSQDFFQLLLDSDLLVLGTVNVTQTDGKTFTAGAGSQFKLVTGEKDGTHFLPVFTAIPRMQAYAQKEAPYIALKGRALLEMTRGAPVTLNPGSEYGREFTPAEILKLLEPGLPLAEPRAGMEELPLPLPLATALADLFDARGDIEMAWMIQMNHADGPMPLVGVQTSAAMPLLMAAIEKMAKEKLPGVAFDVQHVDPARPVAMTQVLMQAKPFYPRGPRTLN